MNTLQLTEQHKKILLECFEDGQQLIDTWEPPENPCRECGGESSIMVDYRTEMSFQKCVLENDEWKSVEAGYIDDGEHDHSEYWCEKCYEDR